MGVAGPLAVEFGLGLFHYFRNDWPRAAALFAEAIRRSDGAYYELYLNLGSALRNMGRIEQAHRCYRIVLEADPDNAIALKYLDRAAVPPG